MDDVVVLFEAPGGGIHVLMPALGCGLTLEEIIEKDVPKNAPHRRIVELSALPTKLADLDACRTLADGPEAS
jgi:hypothetical protein